MKLKNQKAQAARLKNNTNLERNLPTGNFITREGLPHQPTLNHNGQTIHQRRFHFI